MLPFYNSEKWIKKIKLLGGSDLEKLKLSKVQLNERGRIFFIINYLKKYYKNEEMTLPFKMSHLLDSIKRKTKNEGNKNLIGKLSNPDKYILFIEKFCNNLVYVIYGENIKSKPINEEIFLHRLLPIIYFIYYYFSWNLSVNYSFDAIKDALKDIVRAILRVQLKGGENVGIISSTNVMAKATQLVLDAFHKAGVASTSTATKNLETLKKYLKLSKQKLPTIANIDIRLKKNKDNKEYINKYVSKFNLTYIQDIVSIFQIIDDRNFFNGETIISEDKKIVKYLSTFWNKNSSSQFISRSIRIVFDPELLLIKNISLLEVKEIINNSSFNLFVIKISEVVLRVFVIKSNINKSIDEIQYLKDTILNLKKIMITGIKNIKGVVVIPTLVYDTSYDKKTGKKIKTPRYPIETFGSNFEKIMSLDDNIDKVNTITSNTHEIIETLGIYAGYRSLFQQMQSIFHDNGINDIHSSYIKLIAETMTTRLGRTISLSSYGVRSVKNSSPFQMLTFEFVGQVLADLGLYSDKDPLTGVSGSIFTGQMSSMSGTSLHNIIK
jgi:hypothetical protein